LNLRDILAFCLFSVVACPPNYLWQIWLEVTFPGYAAGLTSKEKEKLVDETVVGSSSGVDRGVLNARSEKHAAMTSESAPDPKKVKGSLNIANTIIKLGLDQTVGAALNTIMFTMGIALLRGQGIQYGIAQTKDNFWPLIKAGQKLWPLVSLISLTLVPVEARTTFGSIVGIFWGIFLTMSSNGNEKKVA
jgi:protein Mpv17